MDQTLFEPQWLKQDKQPKTTFSYSKEELLSFYRSLPIPEVFFAHPSLTSQESLTPVAFLPLEQQIVDVEDRDLGYRFGRGKYVPQRGGRGGRGRGERGNAPASGRGREGFRNFRSSREDMWETPGGGSDPFFDKFGGGHRDDPNKWLYKDPQGAVQGPFTNTEMQDWFNAGYFTPSLLLKRTTERYFVELGTLLKSGQSPFISAERSLEPYADTSGNSGRMPPTEEVLVTGPVFVDPVRKQTVDEEIIIDRFGISAPSSPLPQRGNVLNEPIIKEERSLFSLSYQTISNVTNTPPFARKEGVFLLDDVSGTPVQARKGFESEGQASLGKSSSFGGFEHVQQQAVKPPQQQQMKTQPLTPSYSVPLPIDTERHYESIWETPRAPATSVPSQIVQPTFQQPIGSPLNLAPQHQQPVAVWDSWGARKVPNTTSLNVGSLAQASPAVSPPHNPINPGGAIPKPSKVLPSQPVKPIGPVQTPIASADTIQTAQQNAHQQPLHPQTGYLQPTENKQPIELMWASQKVPGPSLKDIQEEQLRLEKQQQAVRLQQEEQLRKEVKERELKQKEVDWTQNEKVQSAAKSAISIKDIQEQELKYKKQHTVQDEHSVASAANPNWASWQPSVSIKPAFVDIQQQEAQTKGTEKESNQELKSRAADLVGSTGSKKESKSRTTKGAKPPASPTVWGGNTAPSPTLKPKSLKEIQAEEARQLVKGAPAHVSNAQAATTTPKEDNDDDMFWDYEEDKTKVSVPAVIPKQDEFPALPSTKKADAATKKPVPKPADKIVKALPLQDFPELPSTKKIQPTQAVPKTQPKAQPIQPKKGGKKRGAKVDPTLLGFTAPTREGIETVNDTL